MELILHPLRDNKSESCQLIVVHNLLASTSQRYLILEMMLRPVREGYERQVSYIRSGIININNINRVEHRIDLSPDKGGTSGTGVTSTSSMNDRFH